MKSIKTRTTLVYMREDGVAVCESLAASEQNLEDAVENIEALKRVLDFQKGLVIVDLRQIKIVNRSARAYYTGPVTQSFVKGIAFVVDSAFSRLMGNIFIGLNKTPYPGRLFATPDEAAAWLKGLPQ